MCALQMRIRLAEYVKRDVVSFDPPVQDRFLGRCIWWKPEPDSVWYKGTITSKDLEVMVERFCIMCVMRTETKQI